MRRSPGLVRLAEPWEIASTNNKASPAFMFASIAPSTLSTDGADSQLCWAKWGWAKFDLWLPGITIVAPSPGSMSVRAIRMLTWPHIKRPFLYIYCVRFTHSCPPEWSGIASPGRRILANASSMNSGPCSASNVPSPPTKYFTFSNQEG